MLLGMIFRLYSENFVEIKALFPEILRFEFVTLFVKHPVVLDRVYDTIKVCFQDNKTFINNQHSHQGWENAGINLVFASQWQKLVYVSLCRH